MKRRDFIQKTGLLGLGVGTLALIRPTNVEGGVSDNATLERIVGHSEIANLGNSLTEIVGNEPLETTAKTLSGGMNELKNLSVMEKVA